MWYQLHINNISKNSEVVQIIVTKNRTIPISRINQFLKVVLLPVLQGTKRKPRWQILETKATFELRICVCCHCCLRLVGFILNVSHLCSIDSSDETCGPRHIYLSLLFLSLPSLFFLFFDVSFAPGVSLTFIDFRHALRSRAKTRVVKTMWWDHAWSCHPDFNSK